MRLVFEPIRIVEYQIGLSAAPDKSQSLDPHGLLGRRVSSIALGGSVARSSRWSRWRATRSPALYWWQLCPGSATANGLRHRVPMLTPSSSGIPFIVCLPRPLPAAVSMISLVPICCGRPIGENARDTAIAPSGVTASRSQRTTILPPTAIGISTVVNCGPPPTCSTAFSVHKTSSLATRFATRHPDTWYSASILARFRPSTKRLRSYLRHGTRRAGSGSGSRREIAHGHRVDPSIGLRAPGWSTIAAPNGQRRDSAPR